MKYPVNCLPTIFVLLLLVAATARSAELPAVEKARGYAVLVLVTSETNPTVNKKLDPTDIDATEIALARIYGALIKADFKDEDITVLYASGGVKLDPAEKRYAELFARLNEKHFTDKNYEATKENTLKAIEAYGLKAKANDMFVFWVLAHGWPNGALEMQKITYLIPRELEASLKSFRVRSMYLLFDCCHSGAILERINLDNAVMVSTTGSKTLGVIAADFSNCARFLECLTDPNCDQDRNGIVDCYEAFRDTLAAARNFDSFLHEHAAKDRKKKKNAEEASTTPQMKVGDRFIPASLFGVSAVRKMRRL